MDIHEINILINICMYVEKFIVMILFTHDVFDRKAYRRSIYLSMYLSMDSLF